MDDLISRQAAIDALDKRFDDVPMKLTMEILQLRRDLRELPSAQPEIIRCKDCKNHNLCDGECDQCPYGKRIPADRGWSKAEFFKEDGWICTLKEED